MLSTNLPDNLVFGLDIGTRSIVGTVGYKSNEYDFTVVAQYARFHDTRAVMDGQVHDIEKVAETIIQVKKELELQLGLKLSEVCIAAAGRVLRTVHVNCSLSFDEETTVRQEHITTLIAGGIEKAYGEIYSDNNNKTIFHCVGHTVMHYYLDQYPILVLDGHRGRSISADVIATFLPQGVVDGLYASIEKAGLTVSNMTLEPIAAINVAIPEKFRMLNIALVDVGAGTSDISVTKDGSIIAYGMFPCAGDAITEKIMNCHLVDFQTAETMKLSSGKKKEITYKDILNCKNKVSSQMIFEETQPVIEHITSEVARQIIELNGGKSVSAVFVVGGGGKFKSFLPELARQLKLPKERVALRGEEVLGSIRFLQEDIKKDSTLVTPIGICLNYYEQKNNLIFVYVNEERIKLYDNGSLTIVDAALKYGFPNEKLFARRGKALNYTLDGERRMLRGELGEPAQILLNGEPVPINRPIIQHDSIKIKESSVGEPAKLTVGELIRNKNKAIQFKINQKKITCPVLIEVNQEYVNEYYQIQDQDTITFLNYYTVERLLEYIDLDPPGNIYLNGTRALLTDKVYENFTLEFSLKDTFSVVGEADEYETETAEKIELSNDYSKKEAKSDSITKNHLGEDEKGQAKTNSTVTVTVNGSIVVLVGKSNYVVVDILDFYDFDVTQMRGSGVVIKVNGEDAEFTTAIGEKDTIELYWKD